MSPVTRYQVPAQRGTIEVDLSRNEGTPWSIDSGTSVDDLARVASRYPEITALMEAIASRHQVEPDQVLVTAGGDDALFRCFLARSGSTVVTTTPTFEMISRYSDQTRCNLSEIPWWSGDFPIESVLALADDASMLVVVSPNNPTGQVITAQQLRSLAGSYPLVVVDGAYSEFAESDLTATALDLGNVVMVRTLSKAFGLAGLRLGYLLGPSPLIEEFSCFGSPYAVSGLSAQLGVTALQDDRGALELFVKDVCNSRADLVSILERLGASPLTSEANFVLATDVDPAWLVGACGSLGVALRQFSDREELDRCVRISVPGNAADFKRLSDALMAALAPECLIFDLDGVIADVSRSYREAIVATAASFGVEVSAERIAELKAAGNSNDDWDLTYRICREAGANAESQDVTSRFEEIYQGSPRSPGLKTNELAMVDAAMLQRWSELLPLGIVTGRPRKDAVEFLDKFGLTGYFTTIVAREDAPLKPDPTPIRLAMAQMGANHAWMIGDTPDDLTAGRSAGAIPIGVVAPGQDSTVGVSALSEAAVVLDSVSQLQEILDVTNL